MLEKVDKYFQIKFQYIFFKENVGNVPYIFFAVLMML